MEKNRSVQQEKGGKRKKIGRSTEATGQLRAPVTVRLRSWAPKSNVETWFMALLCGREWPQGEVQSIQFPILQFGGERFVPVFPVEERSTLHWTHHFRWNLIFFSFVQVVMIGSYLWFYLISTRQPKVSRVRPKSAAKRSFLSIYTQKTFDRTL